MRQVGNQGSWRGESPDYHDVTATTLRGAAEGVKSVRPRRRVVGPSQRSLTSSWSPAEKKGVPEPGLRSPADIAHGRPTHVAAADPAREPRTTSSRAGWYRVRLALVALSRVHEVQRPAASLDGNESKPKTAPSELKPPPATFRPPSQEIVNSPSPPGASEVDEVVTVIRLATLFAARGPEWDSLSATATAAEPSWFAVTPFSFFALSATSAHLASGTAAFTTAPAVPPRATNSATITRSMLD